MVIKVDHLVDFNETLKLFEETKPDTYVKRIGNRVITVVRADDMSTVIESNVQGFLKSWKFEDRGHFQAAMEFAKYVSWLE